MKKYLVTMSLLTTTLGSVASTKQAIDNYEIPSMKIKVDQKKYLKNIMENIKDSIKSGDRVTANNLTLWSKDYIKEFKKIQKENPAHSDTVVNINNFENFTQRSESYLNANANDYGFNQKMVYLELRINNLTNKIADATHDFNRLKPCENKELLKTIVKEYDKILREFSLLTASAYGLKTPSPKMQRRMQNFKKILIENLKTKLDEYIRLILTWIGDNLHNIQKKLTDDITDVVKTQMVNNLHDQYLSVKEQIEFLHNEKIAPQFSYEINKIGAKLLDIKENFQTSEKQLIDLWKTLFTDTKTSISGHIENIETEGEWEKIEVLLESFKTDVKKYLEFKNKNQDLALEHKEVNCLINEIRGVFLRAKYVGITKDERQGTWSQWHLSEPEWNAYRTGANVTGMAIPPLAVTAEGIHRLVAHRVAKRVASATIENTAQTGTRTLLKAFASKIYLGVWTGLAAGLGLFAAPAYSLNFIKTNGAGLSFKYNYLGYASGMLAPSIEIHKTYKPQEMKYLNVWDVEEIKK